MLPAKTAYGALKYHSSPNPLGNIKLPFDLCSYDTIDHTRNRVNILYTQLKFDAFT